MIIDTGDIKMKEKKLAVIFPGIGYHKDKPLLYYASKLVSEKGYDVINIEYHDMPQKIRGSRHLLPFRANGWVYVPLKSL